MMKYFISRDGDMNCLCACAPDSFHDLRFLFYKADDALELFIKKLIIINS